MKFDFNKIKLRSDKEPSLERKLTGESLSELKPIGKGIVPNAELEGDEYLQFPDGAIQRVDGRSHKKSGVKMNIPDGTKILSNKLKLSASNVKVLKEDFDIKLNKNTTFAKAQDRYHRKIGIKELNDKQEKQIKELNKQFEKGDIDEGTFRINQEYLSKQIYDSEQSKEEKQAISSMFFNALFNLQEEGKQGKKQPTAREGNFKYGGVKTPLQNFRVGGMKSINSYKDGGGGIPDRFKDVFKRGLIDVNLSMDEAQKRYAPFQRSDQLFEAYLWAKNCPDGNCFKPTFPDFNESSWDKWSEQRRIDLGFDKKPTVDPVDEPSSGKPSYEQAYEKVDKKKYPTLDSFKDAAEKWKNRKPLTATSTKDGEEVIQRGDENGYEANDMSVVMNLNNPIGTLPFKKLDNLSVPVDRSLSKGFVESRKWNYDKNRWETHMTPEGGIEEDLTREREEWAEQNKPVQGRRGVFDEGNYEYGGLSDEQFSKLTSKFGLSKDQGMKMLGNRVKRFDGGGVAGHAHPHDIDFTPSYSGRSRLADAEVVSQRAGKTAFGEVTEDNIEEVMESLYRNFPDIVGDPTVFGVKYGANGKIDWDRSLNFNVIQSRVEAFQTKANSRMKESANVIINNPERFSKEQVASATEFITDETFEDDKKSVRYTDSKLGQFTAGRYNIGMDVVTPEELKALHEKNIYTVKGLNKALEEDPSLISDLSKARVSNLNEIMTDDSDFSLTEFTAPEVKEVVVPVEEKTKTTPILDDIILKGKKKGLGMLGIPDMAPLPPSGLQAMYAPQSRFGFADPTRIGIDKEIQMTGDAYRTMSESINDLPPQQRAIALAQFQATTNSQLNDAAQSANVINAQNLSSVELFNVGQLDRMYAADNVNKLGFEKNQLTAQALTREDWKNYYDDAINRAMNKFQVKSSLGLLSSMTPDVKLNADMAGVSYDDENGWQINDAGKFGEVFGNPFV